MCSDSRQLEERKLIYTIKQVGDIKDVPIVIESKNSGQVIVREGALSLWHLIP